ncbi:hypothetical protein HG536_0B04920 [Torulaspora globosa]|uniref:BPL/LPL catalytic domain-containing protein n=1 Tax=Torulaspora globosa TaxID=48254 RepID=A0A7G3ZDP2_9SACH|nr:uncharacterized protein HG536_0B04920 [Torulaspora globosa]QLL31628.1 hypothetical protein HG536_0B04920 [Torulaspora globosa]
MNVLVYNGPGTTPGSVKHTTQTLRHFLEPYYAVSTISSKALQTEPWMSKASAIVFPGGADLPYVKECRMVIPKIRDFVERQGGLFIGFCAGGYFGTSRVEFAQGDPAMEVTGNRDLKLFPGISRGPAFDGFRYNSEEGARPCPLILPDGTEFATYFNGGPLFVDADEFNNTEVLARYKETPDVAYYDSSSKTAEAGPAAVVLCSVGKGKALLTGPHPEFIPRLLERTDDVHFLSKVVNVLKENEAKRLSFLKMIFTKAGLNCNNDFSNVRAPNLTPLLVASSEGKQDTVSEFRNNIMNASGLRKTDRYVEIDGGSDIFHFYDGLSSSYDDAAASLLHEEPDEVAKAVIFPAEGETTPSLALTSNFDVDKYFKYLSPTNNIGSLLMYGEVVTSTSSLLNENKIILSCIPKNSMLHVGTIQVSGRGRGGNVWINPKGVSASTAVITLPLRSPKTNKPVSIVFVQYLSMLAYCQAITSYGPGYEDLPVRIKWPNDLYALNPKYYQSSKLSILGKRMGQGSQLQVISVSDIEPAYMKIAGLLVNSNFINDSYTLLLGCGLNVSHDGPTTSLNTWINLLNEEREAARLDNLEPIQIEKLQALYMNHLEAYLRKFIDYGASSILPDYYRLWLHSNQIVTLMDHHNARAMITGITEDYGLLVAKELVSGSNTQFTGSIYHLQPDGNSFDIFKGLISKKAA